MGYVCVCVCAYAWRKKERKKERGVARKERERSDEEGKSAGKGLSSVVKGSEWILLISHIRDIRTYHDSHDV